jgi:hypothetical protein
MHLRFLILCGVVCASGCSAASSPSESARSGPEFPDDIETALRWRRASEPDHAATYAGPLLDAASAEVGSVLFGSCGCGFWRSYVELLGRRLLGRLEFPGFPDSFSQFRGAPDSPFTIRGIFEDAGRSSFGEVRADQCVARFRAARADGADPLYGCRACHLGADAPSPQTAVHMPVSAETNCLECHPISVH